ncbi:MAG TPA: ATP-binding cassette domain-containing protein [Nocardia sp.]|uniref:ATP-binding cassette domain-containing protein n=1 Tax=Nocardia TaxID=1817 RepID=UPI0024585F91|nr:MULTISPECIES: ATP-binding cassette domain-containing protein [Nocardia]HLS78991.1 ATP-binding cassette domain-containing protein [Nocardia sp.]
MPARLRSLTVEIETPRWRGVVLDAVDLTVPAGQITALLGGPGDGKTMTAYALTGNLPGSARMSGEVVVDGAVGYVPQDGITAFARERTVGAQLREIEAAHRGRALEEVCAAACYPLEALDLLPGQNSTGQIQRAALAAALLTDPDVLVADGPTASLDQGTAYALWQTLRACADAGVACLVITHDIPLLTATGYADRVVVMSGGRVLAAGTLAELASSADPSVRMYLQVL